jgi:hypothetical protein
MKKRLAKKVTKNPQRYHKHQLEAAAKRMRQADK